jgi:hypothetical protein
MPAVLHRIEQYRMDYYLAMNLLKYYMYHMEEDYLDEACNKNRQFRDLLLEVVDLHRLWNVELIVEANIYLNLR